MTSPKLPKDIGFQVADLYERVRRVERTIQRLIPAGTFVAPSDHSHSGFGASPTGGTGGGSGGAISHAVLSGIQPNQHHDKVHEASEHLTAITVSDEGTDQGDVLTLDFVGGGVTAAVAGGIATVTIPTQLSAYAGTMSPVVAADKTASTGVSGDFARGDHEHDANITIGDATHVGLRVKGAAAQTADYQRWEDSAGTLLGRFFPGSIPALQVGATSAAALFGADSFIATNTDASPTFRAVVAGSGASNAGAFFASRSRGTLTAPTIVSADDVILRLLGEGYDGSARRAAARIQIEVDGTPGASDMPGRIVFSTTPDGSATLVERGRIHNSGNWNFGSGGVNLAHVGIVNDTATDVGLLVRMAAAQSARWMRVEDSGGNERFALTPTALISRAAATDNAWAAQVDADSFARFVTRADGLLEWGGGAGARETNLYREAANILATDDKLHVVGEIEVDGALNHDGTTVGFYAKVPVVQPTIVKLTDNSGGTGDDTIAAASMLYDPSSENNFRADVARKINEILDAAGQAASGTGLWKHV